MTQQFPNLKIVAVGDEEMVSGLRLSGVTDYRIINESETAREDTRTALTEVIAEAGVGIIAVQEEHAAYAEDIINKVKEAKSLTPIIIEVPSKNGTRYEDVAGYYRAYVREYTGFEVEI